MKFRTRILGALLAMLSSMVWAQAYTNVDEARLVVINSGLAPVGMLGFGRGGSLNLAEASSRSSLAPSFAALADVAETRVDFSDLWWVRADDDVAPGIYSFQNFEINAIGTLQFDFVLFNSIDDAGNLLTTKFQITDDGMTAVGSGNFAVRSLPCVELSSCVFIQVFGTQTAGQLGTDGYGDPDPTVISLIATPVPEPATWAVLALGLVVVGGVVRRRARA